MDKHFKLSVERLNKVNNLIYLAQQLQASISALSHELGVLKQEHEDLLLNEDDWR